MSHISDDRLVDLALGEAADPAEHDHLLDCATCTQVRVALLETVSVTRRARPELLVAPPPRVWEAIAAEIGSRRAPGASPWEQPGEVGEGKAGQSNLDENDLGAPLSRVSRLEDRRTTRRRQRPITWLLAAACVLGIVLGVGGATIASRLGAEPEPSEVIVASASLAPLDSSQTMGVASLVDREEGLRLDLPDLGFDPGEGFLEVWLINRDLTRMISVGVIPVDATEVVLPVSQRLIDEGYVIVDISREPFDDQPAHSGQTLVRGELSV